MASVYTVTQVNGYIRNLFDTDFALKNLSVKGEVSNCKYHTSGHIYFTLKDNGGVISAVMFQGSRRGLDFTLQEGQKVIVTGQVGIYEPAGKYQLYAKKIVMEGRGDLFARYQELKNRLEEMGMFDPSYKKPIPPYAMNVGIVTAQTGAAIQDIINISSRRNPYVQLVLCPSLVQGEQAAPHIARGIRRLDEMHLDVLIVGRGGGSIEDLWAFNEEEVARAIFDCETPVISAVGHETDVTIADFVADLRAPTPSAAAELAVFDYGAFLTGLEQKRQFLQGAMGRKLEQARGRLAQDGARLSYVSPQSQLRTRRQQIVELQDRLDRVLDQSVLTQRHRLSLLTQKLEGQSPLGKISQGFGYIQKEGQKITKIDMVHPGDQLQITIRDGQIEAAVTGTNPGKLS